MRSCFDDGATVLFQGDSITDAGRSRKDLTSPYGLGGGYAMMAASWFSAAFPEKRVTFLNRGVSGNRVKDLVHRWEEDCLALNPSWVSIMIGINDTWRRFDRHDPTPTEDYERDYRAILSKAKNRLQCGFILVEPFVLPYPEDRKAWRSDLDPRIEVVHKLAREFGALLVPMDRVFAEAATRREPSFWAPDGVHPSPAGHALIARTWLETVGAIPGRG